MIRIDWIQVYWWLLFGGLGITLLYLFIGDLIEGIVGGIEGVFNPILLFSTLSIIGGAGVLLNKYTSFSEGIVLTTAIIIGFIGYIVAYYIIDLPISRAEVSTTFSVKELEGNIGEVITSIPSNGYGEIIVSTISGTLNFTAASYDGIHIPSGTRVVVIHAEQDHLLVSLFEEGEALDK